MSRIISNLDIMEVQVDKDGNYLRQCESPIHFEEIAKNLCESWNSMHMEQFFGGILEEKVVKSRMKPNNRNKTVEIITDFIPGFRLSEKRRDEFHEQMSAQICDGWGEGVLGPINILAFSDGTYGYAD